MLVGDFTRADADLYLLDSLGEEVLDVSMGIGEVETLVVPEDGTYLIRAFAYRGATNYILAIGASTTPNQYMP